MKQLLNVSMGPTGPVYRAPGSEITENILSCIDAIAIMREADHTQNMFVIVAADISSSEPVFEVVEMGPEHSLKKLEERTPVLAMYTSTMPVLGDPQAVYRVFDAWLKRRAQYKRELAARLDNDGPINPALFQDPRDAAETEGQA